MRSSSGLLSCLALLCVILQAAAAGAQCTVSAVAAHFGTYDESDTAPLDATGRVDVACDPGMAFSVILDAGRHAKGDFRDRRMQRTGSSETLAYNLWTDPAFTRIWGDGTMGTFLQAGVGTESFTVYGRMPPLQGGADGPYGDVVSITVSW